MADSSAPAAEAPATTALPEPAEPLIDIDTESTFDGDSALGDDQSALTASLTSTVLNYPYENGRRYHAYQQGKYIMPNDEQENDRLDMAHHMMILRTDGKLHLAPIGKNPQRILDLGTGTGIWCIEMGDEYPSAQILGNDLSPVQPTMSRLYPCSCERRGLTSCRVPPNVKFEVDDVESEWTFTTPFDYIHCRYLATSIADWPGLVRKCSEHVAPGGWVEFQDYDMQYYSEDGSLKPEHAVARWIGLSIEASNDNGRTPSPGPQLKAWVQDAGFVDIHHQRLKLPIGRWPKDPQLKTVGAWNLLQILEGLEGFSMALFTRKLGWSHQEVQLLLAQVRANLKDPAIHAQLDFHVVYGRKPPLDE